MSLKMAEPRGAAGVVVVGLSIAVVMVFSLVGTALALDERYHTFEETRAELLAVAASYPEIVLLDTLGYSTTDSMAIWGVKISDNAAVDEDEPVVLYDGVHHAEEVLGLEVCLWMIDELTSGYGVNDTITAWIDDCEIWFIPLLNPEGHAVVTAEVDTTWRKNKRDNNENGQFDLDYDGVDLNYNYDFNWDQGGSENPASEYYRGPTAFSENETQIMRDFCLAEKPVLALNYHSPRSSDGDLIYYPWYWVGYGFAPDHHTIYAIASELGSRTLNEDGVPYAAYYGYATKGKARNWQYGVVGTIGLTMEILSRLCQPSGDRVDAICQNVAAGSYYLIERTYGPGLTGHVTDASTGLPIVAEIEVLENSSELLEPRTTDPTYGRYWRLLNAGTYTVEASCPGYEIETVANVVVDSTGMTVLDFALEPWVGVPDDAAGLAARVIQVFPNPFRDSTTVGFYASPGSQVVLDVFSAAGRRVARLSAQAGERGLGVAQWDGTDSTGARAPSGVYFVRMATGEPSDGAKVLLLR